MPELTKVFPYLSREREEDEKHPELEYHSTFAKRRAEAMDYHMQVSNPRATNWAELTFIWY